MRTGTLGPARCARRRPHEGEAVADQPEAPQQPARQADEPERAAVFEHERSEDRGGELEGRRAESDGAQSSVDEARAQSGDGQTGEEE